MLARNCQYLFNLNAVSRLNRRQLHCLKSFSNKSNFILRNCSAIKLNNFSIKLDPRYCSSVAKVNLQENTTITIAPSELSTTTRETDDDSNDPNSTASVTENEFCYKTLYNLPQYRDMFSQPIKFEGKVFVEMHFSCKFFLFNNSIILFRHRY